MYSKRAMPQLAKAAIYQAILFRFFRWEYHAKVMKMLEMVRRIMVFAIMGVVRSRTRFIG